MTREEARRARVEELLAYDFAVCSWLRADGLSVGGGEVPFDAPRNPADPSEPHLRLAGFDEAGRGRTPRPILRLAGFDEAGRGALAGPVVVACVHLDLALAGRRSELVDALCGVDDSKRLSAARRERLFDRITAGAIWAVGAASAAEIDRSGIVSACRVAARRACRALNVDVDAGLFDRGLSLRAGVEPKADTAGTLPEATATGADGRSLHVACASILAKVTRDRIMCRLDDAFRGYAFERHKGYGTVAHREAIRVLGPSRVHRRTFLRGCESAESQSC
ncbi:ribonuclease HII [Candidatus Bipolaricaulota bacterium]